jgi:hypothetical protein
MRRAFRPVEVPLPALASRTGTCRGHLRGPVNGVGQPPFFEVQFMNGRVQPRGVTTRRRVAPPHKQTADQRD